jgi:hypothetical protein
MPFRAGDTPRTRITSARGGEPFGAAEHVPTAARQSLPSRIIP